VPGKKFLEDAIRVNLMVPSKLMAAFQKLATRQGTTASHLIRKAMMEHLKLLVASHTADKATRDAFTDDKGKFSGVKGVGK
jgi:hypothetical protein